MSDEQNGNQGAIVVRPQGQIVGLAAEEKRAVAEIQSALTVAAARPRDQIACIDRIKTACERQGLAERSQYSFQRGGSEITGPTIDLLTVIANSWGNIWFGFRELLQSAGESTVEAFAWDLETNSKRTAVFTVPHKRATKIGTYALTDPRDIYELVANQAQRRVRACLEAVIPPDIVEDAVNHCNKTLNEKAKVTPESIAAMLTAYKVHGVGMEQIEKRLGRRLETMQPAQLVSLRRIYKSLADGMSKPSDWFEMPATEAKSPNDAVKDALRGQATAEAAPRTPAEEPAKPEPAQAAERQPGDDDEQAGPSQAAQSVAKLVRDKLADPSRANLEQAAAILQQNRQGLGEDLYMDLLDELTRTKEEKTAKGGKKKSGQMFPDAAANPV